MCPSKKVVEVKALKFNSLFDESVQHVLQFSCIVSSVDNVTLVFDVELGLGAQLATEVFAAICSAGVHSVSTYFGKHWEGFHLQVGGLPRALAMSTMFGMTVLTPFPLPSTLAWSLGILYR